MDLIPPLVLSIFAKWNFNLSYVDVIFMLNFLEIKLIPLIQFERGVCFSLLACKFTLSVF
jgi:hypothetical protein